LDPDVFDLVRLPLVWKGLNLILLGVMGVHDDHEALLSLKFCPYLPIFSFTWQEALSRGGIGFVTHRGIEQIKWAGVKEVRTGGRR
jgi:hypothetical protein